MSELRGVVYVIKKRGQEQSLVERRKNRYGERRNYFRISPGKDERTDLNQSRTVPVIPNHEERRNNKMLWSIVSNAAERSRRQRHDIFESLWH